MPSSTLLRRLAALIVVAFSLWLWTWQGPSDVIYLIVNWKPVLFNRYSQGHFGALLVLTPLLWVVAGALWSRRPLRQSLGNAALGTATTLLAILLITYLAHFARGGPRYVEVTVDEDAAEAHGLAGTARHRPPNERYDLTWADEPEHPRSYPNAPPGYGAMPIVLTSDERGFRNPNPSERYDVVAVGDSFVAGSHVSDDQGWTELLQRNLDIAIYNLGVSGSGPSTYLNNFVYYGTALQPRIALFMIYEGNDFKAEVAARDPSKTPPLAERLGEHFRTAMKASPVTGGLEQLSTMVFQRAGAQSPVPGYAERVGFMPLRVAAAGKSQHYAFEPRRLLYLNVEQEQFAASEAWQSTRRKLERMAATSREHGIVPVFLYAPSTPHVVLPLAAALPAEQLRNFVAYRKERLAQVDAQAFKAELLGNLDNQEAVFTAWCRDQRLACLPLTEPLRRATAAGRQTYYSYDQHWTPDGNAVVAEAVAAFLQEGDWLTAP